MKPRNYISGLLVLMAITFSTPAISYAQHHHHHRPHWVDVHCCHEATRYVYFPEHNFYYDLEEGLYIYLSNGVWAFSYDVPVYYAHIDLGIAPIIELDIHIDRPYLHNHDHIVWYRNHHHHDYVRYYDGHRYYRNHDRHYGHGHGHKHGHYKKGHDNGNHYGHYKNHDNNYRGDRHGNGNHSGGHYKKYENKGKGSTYANKERYEHRGNRSGNGRNGDGGRNENGRRR